MGDRRMAEIKTADGSLYVYTHWGGGEMVDVAINAILAAKGRWNDSSYATRIIVDQLTKPSRDSETGHGLMLGPNAEDEYNGGSPSIIIDLVHRVFSVMGKAAEPTTPFTTL
jgi:hypothetical protein